MGILLFLFGLGLLFAFIACFVLFFWPKVGFVLGPILFLIWIIVILSYAIGIMSGVIAFSWVGQYGFYYKYSSHWYPYSCYCECLYIC